MYSELKKMGKETVMAYFNVLSGETEENYISLLGYSLSRPRFEMRTFGIRSEALRFESAVRYSLTVV